MTATATPRVLAAPDKFRGTVSAGEAAAAIAEAAHQAGFECDQAPMADGGEGTLEALGGPNRSSQVTGPDGTPVNARWRLARQVAVIEMAQASGLALAGGAANNDPVAATTTGTGQLIAEAIRSGARRVIVAVGGSATTDGGLGALEALPSEARMRGVELVVACDVRTLFVDAAATFGPQKGASPKQVELLRRRLTRLAEVYHRRHGVDVTELPGSGAAGGLAGGLAARGAALVDGFEMVADEIDLHARLEAADLVLTGEGKLDATSLEGKVTGGVAALAAGAGRPAVAVVGTSSLSDDAQGLEVIDLTARFGSTRARGQTAECIQKVVGDYLRQFPGNKTT